jgi:hypothetical protein
MAVELRPLDCEGRPKDETQMTDSLPDPREWKLLQHLLRSGWVRSVDLAEPVGVIASTLSKGWLEKHINAGVIWFRLSEKGVAAMAASVVSAREATATRPVPVPNSPISKISWPQVGRVNEPGRYMFRFGFLTITAEDLAIWRQHPTADFTLLRTTATDDEFRLGTFELRDDLSIRTPPALT